MPEGIKQQIIKEFSHVWELNDEAHRLKHFENVEKCGFAINEALGLGFDPRLITMVAFFHDMYAWSRYNHHEMSAHWIRTTDHPLVTQFDPEDRYLIEMGCWHHRASYDGYFYSKFDELMNAADRELPGDVENMVERAVLYRINKGMSREEAYGPAVEHIKEKFGSVSGYARYPQLYLDVFGDLLTEQRRVIDQL